MALMKKGSGDEIGINTIIIIVLLSVFTIFILQNTDVVEIRLLLWKVSLSRVVLLLGSLFMGILIGLLIGWEMAVRKNRFR
ncbi:MAG: LapA family protein [Nitrospiraceae bacterium]|nr:MAG: LapA family protein [Nitrospiraceae bacterium]